MKEIKAIVQSAKIQKIHDAFHHRKGFPGVSAVRVDWFGSHERSLKTPKEELTDFARRTLLVILAPDDLVEEMIKTLIDCTYTGQAGDGVIWVTSVENSIRIGEAREEPADS